MLQRQAFNRKSRRALKAASDPIRLFQRRCAALPPMPAAERELALEDLVRELGVDLAEAQALGAMP